LRKLQGRKISSINLKDYFAGAGDVFGPSSNLSANSLKYSVGTGLRFIVDPAERLNIRLDYGYGREGGYFYFVVGESF
jgi:hypothetical protein